MTDRNIEASKRLFEMAQEGKTPEEMTAELAAMGSTLFVKPGHKFGNAILDQGVGSVELVTVEDGKVINSDGGTENDKVYFCGEVYHFAADHETLVKGEPEPHPGGGQAAGGGGQEPADRHGGQDRPGADAAGLVHPGL